MRTAAARKAEPSPGMTLEDRSAFAEILVAGETLVCDWSGCLYWPQRSLLAVSDLHLEKGSSFARQGSFLPPYDSLTTLDALAARIAHWQPQTVVSLGDSFHDREASQRLPEPMRARIASMTADRDWFWISGNHDPAPPGGLGGKPADELMIGNLVFRHEPSAGAAPGEIAGHLHPAGKIVRRSKAVRRPCFITDGSRMILPAFGAYTGGLNVRDMAFSGLFDKESLSAVLLGNGRVFHISGRQLAS